MNVWTIRRYADLVVFVKTLKVDIDVIALHPIWEVMMESFVKVIDNRVFSFYVMHDTTKINCCVIYFLMLYSLLNARFYYKNH